MNAASISKLLRSLADDYGKNSILVSHDPNTVEYFPARVCKRDGQFVTAA